MLSRMNEHPNAQDLEYLPVNGENLSDLSLFSQMHGKFRYCSCMRWRMRSSDFNRSSKEERVTALEALVEKGIPVGVLAYARGKPVGWCSVAPRENYEALERYKALPRLDNLPVWSVTCFFVDRHFRSQGVTLGLLKAAVDYAKSQGARVIEGYPVESGSPSYTYMGSPGTFLAAGFRDATPAGQERWVMRYEVENHATPKMHPADV